MIISKSYDICPRDLRLHLGCGDIRIDGYVNIDVRPGPSVDLVQDISTLTEFSPNSASSIYACHVLEHFSHRFGHVTVPCDRVLARWFEVLKPGGQLFVAVPDLVVLLKALKSCRTYEQSIGPIMAIFGGQNYVGNTHYSGFTPRTLKNLLLQTGFTAIEKFVPFVKDTTQFEPNGLKLSLNLKAVKPT